ncbi:MULTISPECIES: L-aspartate oxidase [Methylosinus]|uniref:L-aspartate oxidase n=1 Tax=Methylosinus trichosporium (strain ATCC 35070 / NCIMB 11131 / UNIQEM 75 / OB3b) TaxID=595536 RepID=A0A2D2CZQ5_METT3|nr:MULTISPECIES: L-aspartate oxidase [Methylosinus]ATQ68220.1 L-aspartate oxidase [Methylosinus trichosporium OB3b]OBS50584.1 L-aspartate oxidase [Methylosinus sp. 3S-1]
MTQSAKSTERPAILIVGGGLAGLFCALKLAPRRVAVLTPGAVDEGAASFWAQGGVAAAVLDTDSPERHAEDTVKAGAGIVDAEVALGMAREARARIDDLFSFGVPFDREGSNFTPSREAAHSERRIVRVKGDTAGRAIMETLVRAARASSSIELVEGFSAQELLMRDGRVIGLRALHRGGATRDFLAPAVVLATGGIGHLYRVTTNPNEACGIGLAIAARAGALIADPEFVQFHPTAIDIGADPAPLATESLRGEGATIVDRAGRRFMADIDPAAELAPRDIVARGVFASIAAGRGAFLDARVAVGAEFPTRFPTVYASCRTGGVDPVRQPIPIAPAAHYHMGGVATDARGRTSLAGLWAAGEVASTGVHGANRLASNSLLEALVFSARIADDLRDMSEEAPSVQNLDSARAQDALDAALVEELRDVMARDVGVIRDRAGLARAACAILSIEAATTNAQLRNMATTALFVASAALARRESRGGHFRSDFPQADAALAQRSYMTLAQARALAEEAL